MRWRNDAVEKTAPSRELGPQASGWATQENRKETLMAIRVGVNMLQFCSVSNSLSHTTLSNKVRGIYFLRTVSLVIIVLLLWFCMHMCLYSRSWLYHIWKAIEVTLHSRKMKQSEWELVLPDALHSIRSLLSTATKTSHHTRSYLILVEKQPQENLSHHGWSQVQFMLKVMLTKASMTPQ